MMQQEFKMNSEKKVYRKPVMEVVEMDYGPSVLLDASGEIETEFTDGGTED